MKRKVIQIADSTQLISLPRKWAQKYNIKKGDELEVEEDGGRVIVSTQRSDRVESIDLDVVGIESKMIRRLIAALYKSGFDEFRIHYSASEELQSVQTVVKNTCLGFEIVEQTKDTVVIRKVTAAIYEGFPPLFRRTFLFLISMANESLRAITERKINLLKDVIQMDSNVNKLTDFCRRILNKEEHSHFKRSPPVYYIAEQLEKIGDEYKSICIYLAERKSMKLGKDSLQIYKEVNKLLESFYALFYKFDLDMINDFRLKAIRINNKINDSINKLPRSELRVLLHLNTLSRIIYATNGAIIISHFSNSKPSISSLEIPTS